MWLAALGAACSFGGEAFGQKKDPVPAKAKAEDLLAADAFPKKWKDVSSDKKTKLGDTWKLDTTPKIPVLNCTGKPPGYVRTVEKFTNFDLTLEWLYPGDKECNSGILVYCGEDKVWPASVQIQLHRPLAGSIFPMKGATTASVVTVSSLKLDVATWHTCRVLSMNGTITLWINSKKVGGVAGCNPSSGYIGLQSEGFPIKFRRFEITRLPDPPAVKPKNSKTTPAKKPPPPKVGSKTAVYGGEFEADARRFNAISRGTFTCCPRDVAPRTGRCRRRKSAVKPSSRCRSRVDHVHLRRHPHAE